MTVKSEQRRWDADRHKQFRKDIARLVVEPLAAQRSERLRRLAEVRKQVLK